MKIAILGTRGIPASYSGFETAVEQLASRLTARGHEVIVYCRSHVVDPSLRTYKGAVVLVTHDEGAVEALQPERIILLPDGVEDLWGSDYADLVSLA